MEQIIFNITKNVSDSGIAKTSMIIKATLDSGNLTKVISDLEVQGTDKDKKFLEDLKTLIENYKV